jgi:hypothetical protein
MLKYVLLGLIVVAGFCGCLKNSSYSNSASCSYDPCGYKAPDSEIVAVKHYVDSLNIPATQHCSGLFYKIDTLGTGSTPTACSVVSVRYKGALTNGNVFDQSTTPVTFPLSNLIGGWINGVPLIKQGGVIHLYIPPALGYGYNDVKDNKDSVIIPAKSVLVFDVSLVGVQ